MSHAVINNLEGTQKKIKTNDNKKLSICFPPTNGEERKRAKMNGEYSACWKW